MDVWHETNWFAVQTKPHQENLAASAITKLDIESFLPRIRREQDVCGVSRLLTRPLFPGYIFAKFCPLLSLEAVQHSLGVLRVLGTRQYPLSLEPQVVSSIEKRIGEDGFFHLAVKGFQSGDDVKIKNGPLSGWMGRVECEWNDGKRVLILLEAVQQARVLVEKRCINAVDAR